MSLLLRIITTSYGELTKDVVVPRIKTGCLKWGELMDFSVAIG